MTESFKTKNYETVRQRKDDLLRAAVLYKSRRGCIECGERNPHNLTFHHINPADKKFNVTSELGTRSLDSIELEVEKCWIVCHSCHKLKYTFPNLSLL